jgi:hypothetical protein
MVVRDVFEEGWQECKRGLQVLTRGGSFFDENPRQGGIYNFQFQYPGFAHSWNQKSE